MQLKFSATTPSSSSWLPSNIEQSRDPAEQQPKKQKKHTTTTTRFNYQGNWLNEAFSFRLDETLGRIISDLYIYYVWVCTYVHIHLILIECRNSDSYLW